VFGGGGGGGGGAPPTNVDRGVPKRWLQSAILQHPGSGIKHLSKTKKTPKSVCLSTACGGHILTYFYISIWRKIFLAVNINVVCNLAPIRKNRR
jgi:hypothetical protein